MMSTSKRPTSNTRTRSRRFPRAQRPGYRPSTRRPFPNRPGDLVQRGSTGCVRIAIRRGQRRRSDRVEVGFGFEDPRSGREENDAEKNRKSALPLLLTITSKTLAEPPACLRRAHLWYEHLKRGQHLFVVHCAAHLVTPVDGQVSISSRMDDKDDRQLREREREREGSTRGRWKIKIGDQACKNMGFDRGWA